MLYVIIISHSGEREKSVLSSRVADSSSFIREKEKRLQTRKSNQKEKQPAGDLANGLEALVSRGIIYICEETKLIQN